MEKNYGALERGMPVSIPVSVFDSKDQPLDLTDQPIYFTIKPQKFDYDRDDRHAVVAKQFSAWSGVTNQFCIQLTAKDMDFAPGEYFFDVVIGGWRAIRLSFTLTGGPTNRSVLDYEQSYFSCTGRPIRIIQKPEKPIIIISDFNPYLANIREQIKDDRYYPLEVKKVYGADRLYETWYDYIKYSAQPVTPVQFAGGGCSAFRKGNLVGRSFDWLFDNSVSFVVHTPKIGSHYASIGVGRYHSLTESVVLNDPQNPDFKILPNYIVDGINEHGLYANTNVTSLDYGFEETVPEVEPLERVENLTLIRFILDNFKTAKEAIEYIKKYVIVYPSQYLLNNGETLHVMLADAEDNYILEFIHGEVYAIPFNYMTNFNIYRIRPNADGTLYTPQTQDETHNAVKTNQVTENGTGLERFNLIAKAYNDLEDKRDFERLLDKLKYSNTYISSPTPASPFWYTEAVGAAGLKVNSPLADFAPVILKMDEMYLNRDRNNPQTWQTVHNAIYDLKNKKVYIRTQEGEKEFEFSL